MKKFLTVFIIFLSINSVFADEINDKINILYAENNLKEAFNLLLTIPEEERTATNWLLMGNIMQDEKRIDDAIFMYNSAISADEKSFKAHYNLGNIYFEQGQTDKAIEEFKKTVKYNPAFAYGYYNLGCAYLKAGKYKAAKWEFLRAIDLNNQIADFHYNLAYTYKQLKNEKQAKVYLGYYNKIIEREQ